MVCTVIALRTLEPDNTYKIFYFDFKVRCPASASQPHRDGHYHDKSTQFTGFAKSASCMQPKSQKSLSVSGRQFTHRCLCELRAAVSEQAAVASISRVAVSP
uniref:Uncharacterized protein n=1 Tax=Rhipicephalus zambeziensis TaxID=60191 RepID=A0A224Y971_9ACAR